MLRGEEGDDILNGGSGADSLYGGSGHDTFQYAASTDAGDTIYDFQSGDVIQISSDMFDTIGDATMDNVVYDPGTGILRVDLDGAGGSGPITLLTLDGAPLVNDNNGSLDIQIVPPEQ